MGKVKINYAMIYNIIVYILIITEQIIVKVV